MYKCPKCKNDKYFCATAEINVSVKINNHGFEELSNDCGSDPHLNDGWMECSKCGFSDDRPAFNHVITE